MLRSQNGSILIEGLIALLIFSIGILGLLGMQSLAVKNATQANYRNEAGQLASQILSQMMVDEANVSTKYGDTGGGPARLAWDTQVASVLPNGTGSVSYVDTVATPRQANVTITWRAHDETVAQTHSYVTSARIMPAVN